jgi:serine/threonine protein kinase
VYRAIHKPTEQVVAVKVINKQKMSPSELEKIYVEIEMHKRLLHTNIVRIYEVVENDDKIYIFMELCKNG